MRSCVGDSPKPPPEHSEPRVKSKHYFYHIPGRNCTFLKELQKVRRYKRRGRLLYIKFPPSGWDMQYEYLGIAKIKHIFILGDDLMQMQDSRTNRYNGVQLNKMSGGIIFSFPNLFLPSLWRRNIVVGTVIFSPPSSLSFCLLSVSFSSFFFLFFLHFPLTVYLVIRVC